MSKKSSVLVAEPYRVAAQAAIHQLYAYLGSGEKLDQALNDLKKTNKYVSSPFADAMALFKIECDRQDGLATSIRVTCIPDSVDAVMVSQAPAATPGLWTASFDEFGLGGDLIMTRLIVEGGTVSCAPLN